MKKTVVVCGLVALLWGATGVFNAGVWFAHSVRTWPELAKLDGCKLEKHAALFFAVGGPLALPAALINYDQGWLWPHDCA